MAKTTDIPILRFNGICSNDMQKMGINRIAKSDVTLTSPDATNQLIELRQCPGVVGSQILRLGTHANIPAKNVTV